MSNCVWTGRRDKRRGVILIITLWVLVILSSIALSYAYYAKLDLRMTSYSTDTARAAALARSGFYRACIYLRDDKLKDEDILDNDDLVELDDDDRGFIYDAFNEEWFSVWYDEDLEENGFRKITEFGKGSFRVTVTDETGKLNINTAPQKVLQDLLIVCGVREEKALAISAAIVDWRDEDDQPSDGGEEGFGDALTEDTYYNPEQKARDIEAQGPNYVTKNAPFDDIEELLLVRGMTPFIFYGEDANDNRKLDPNEKDGRKTPPDDDGDDRLMLGIRPFVTVYSDQPLNINTAPREVLQALFRSFDDSDAENLADDVVQYRLGTDDRPGTRDDRPIRTLDDSDGDGYHLTDIRSLQDGGLEVLLRTMPVGVASDVFTIESVGEAGGVQRKLTAVVRRHFTEPLELKGEDASKSLLERRKNKEETPEPVRFYVLRMTEEGI